MVNSRINYQAQLVSLPDFWTINSINKSCLIVCFLRTFYTWEQCVLHIFHHFESMCIGMFEFIYGQHIHIYISNCRSALQHSPLHATSPRTTFFQCCEMSKMKGRKTKTPYGLNPPTRKLTFFWYPSGSIHFLKKSCNQQKMFGAFNPHLSTTKNTASKKNNKRVFFHQTKKTDVFFSTWKLYIHRQNAANEELQGWR